MEYAQWGDLVQLITNERVPIPLNDEEIERYGLEEYEDEEATEEIIQEEELEVTTPIDDPSTPDTLEKKTLDILTDIVDSQDKSSDDKEVKYTVSEPNEEETPTNVDIKTYTFNEPKEITEKETTIEIIDLGETEEAVPAMPVPE